MNFREFLKYVLIVIISSLATLGILFFLFYLSLLGLASGLQHLSDDATVKTVKRNTVLELRLDYPVQEYNDNPFQNFDPVTFKFKPTLTLRQIIEAIDMAADDPNIKGLLIHPGLIQAGSEHLEEISQAVEEFAASGKPVASYGEIYSQKGYYLATAAQNPLFIHPMGTLDWRGLAAQVFFYKDLLDKLGIRMQVVRAGKFKSAVEPFIQDSMSPANRQQLKILLHDVWDTYVRDIEKRRRLSRPLLDSAAESLRFVTARDWQNAGFFDNVVSQSEMIDLLKDLTGTEDDIHFMNETDYYYKKRLGKLFDKGLLQNKIAVLLAEGEIVDGEGERNQIGADRMKKLIRKIRRDDEIKAVVLRINSPGGSALASELIWEELKKLTETKPLIVSMGNVAASGGYYIATPADYIFAGETTVTGSIGVFGLIPDMHDFFENKLRIRIDTVKTHAHADMGIFRPLDEKEKAYFQKSVQHVYQTFLERVAEGRNMGIAQADSLGQGRVWSGKRAVQLGLADETGDLQAAVKHAALAAGLSDYEIKYFPKSETSFFEIFSVNEAAAYLKNRWIKNLLGTEFMPLPHPSRKQIMARMPFDLKWTGND